MEQRALVFGTLAAIALLHLTTMLLAYVAWRRRTARDGDADGDAGAERAARYGVSEVKSRYVDGGGDTITCPRCRTVNERGYAYCRDCVGELPADARPAEIAGSGLSERPR